MHDHPASPTKYSAYLVRYLSLKSKLHFAADPIDFVKSAVDIQPRKVLCGFILYFLPL